MTTGGAISSGPCNESLRRAVCGHGAEEEGEIVVKYNVVCVDIRREQGEARDMCLISSNIEKMLVEQSRHQAGGAVVRPAANSCCFVLSWLSNSTFLNFMPSSSQKKNTLLVLSQQSSVHTSIFTHLFPNSDVPQKNHRHQPLPQTSSRCRLAQLAQCSTSKIFVSAIFHVFV